MGIEEQVQEYFQQKAKAEGKTEGRAETKEIVVKNLIAKLGLSDQQVMDVAEVNISYVKRIRKSLLSVQ